MQDMARCGMRCMAVTRADKNSGASATPGGQLSAQTAEHMESWRRLIRCPAEHVSAIAPGMQKCIVPGFGRRTSPGIRYAENIPLARYGGPMKFLCLVYSDEKLLHSLPESPKDSECMAYSNSVKESGRMIAAEALEPVSTATTVRVRNGKITITDGPFAETKEQLAGFYLVDAESR